MPEVKITPDTFMVNGERYYRNRSEDVEAGSVGEKTNPLGPKAGITVHDQIARSALKGRVRYVTTVEINWDSYKKADVEGGANLKYFTLAGSGQAAFSYEKARSERLKLVKFVIDEGDLQAMLNNDANAARKYLANEGNDGRIASAVFVIMNQQTSLGFTTAASTGGSITAALSSAAQLQITARQSGSSQSQVTVTMSKYTTYAYSLHKVTKWNKDKTRVEELKIDKKEMS